MTAPMQYDLLAAKKRCRCGGQLLYDGRFYFCNSCYRLYCTNCFGFVIPAGGCFTCLSCGGSQCS